MKCEPSAGTRIVGLALAAGWLLASIALADNWPQWRGPGRDGNWQEAGIAGAFPVEGAKVVWRAPAGAGWSSPVIAEGRVYLVDSELNQPAARERVQCFDASTGRVLWSDAYDVTYPDWAFGAEQNGGPTATPAIANGMVYALGGNGEVRCLTAAKGEVVWHKDLGKEYEVRTLMCRASPLIDGDLLILFVGGKPVACVVALDRHTGREVWKALEDSVSNSSPIIITAGGRRQLIVWTGESVTSLDPATGATFWREPMTTSNNDGNATPVWDGERLLVSGLMFKLDADKPAATVVWPENRGVSKRVLSNTSTPLLAGDLIFSATNSSDLVCLDARTGQEIWRTDKVTARKSGPSIHLTPNGETVFLYTDEGVLIRARLTAAGYEELDRTRLIEPVYPFGGHKLAWAPPSFANRCIFVRNEREIVCASLGTEPDLIMHHGRIVTVDEAFSIREALAVQDGRVKQTGTDDEILKLKGPGTEVIDLAGRMLVPGLMDSHVHPDAACMTEFDHPIPDMQSIDDVLEHVKARAKAVKEGDWIVLSQVFITRLREQRYPTRAELDAAAPRNPVVFRTGPDASLNTLALKLSGIDRDFKVTDGGGGFAEKDPATSEPTGILRNCTSAVKAVDASKPVTSADHLARLRELFADYNSVGITSICDRDASLDAIDRYRELRERGALTVRVSCSQGIASTGEIAKLQAQIQSVARNPLHTERDDWLRIIGIKMYLDGGMLTGSAYLRQPWGVSKIYSITDPAYRGVLFIPHGRLLPLVRTALESGLAFTAHSVGDGAVHELLGVYDELDKDGLPVRETRSSITHSNFMSAEAVAQAARLGVMLDVQPVWLFLDGHTLAKQFGDERLRWFQPLHSLFDAGVNVGGGSDHMQKIGSLRSVNPYNPFLGIATAVTRRARGLDTALHPEEALTREQALRLYTINNARLLHCDDRRGSLDPGKLADFAVLDSDLLTCPAERIAQTQVLRTYVGGRLVFARGR